MKLSNELLQTNGMEILNWILTSLQQTKDFVIEQAPDVIKQLLMYELIPQVILLIVLSTFLLSGIIVFVILYNKSDKHRYKESADYHQIGELDNTGDYLRSIGWVSLVVKES